MVQTLISFLESQSPEAETLRARNGHTTIIVNMGGGGDVGGDLSGGRSASGTGSPSGVRILGDEESGYAKEWEENLYYEWPGERNRIIDDFTPYQNKYNDYMKSPEYGIDEVTLNYLVNTSLSKSLLKYLEIKSITIGNKNAENINDKNAGINAMDIQSDPVGIDQTFQMLVKGKDGAKAIYATSQRVFTLDKNQQNLFFGSRIHLSPSLFHTSIDRPGMDNIFRLGIIGHEMVHAFHHKQFNRSKPKSPLNFSQRSEAYAYLWQLNYSFKHNLLDEVYAIRKYMEKNNVWPILFTSFDPAWYFSPF